MVRTLILALGNPLSGDDAFGSLVLDVLSRSGLPPETVAADAGTDLLNYLDDFSGYGQVILIDAILDPDGKLGSPGHVITVEEGRFSCWDEVSASAHQMTPVTAIKLFRMLNPAAETRIYLVGLLVDRITHTPLYATPECAATGADAVRLLLAKSAPAPSEHDRE